MTNIDLFYYGFSILVICIIIIAVRNMNKNMDSGDTLMFLLWSTLCASAIIYWVVVSGETDADTRAFLWFYSKLRILWAKIDSANIIGVLKTW